VISVSDAHGHAAIYFSEKAAPMKYRLGLGITDFLMCQRCGVYVAAVAEMDGQHMCVLNARALDCFADIPAAQSVSFAGETVEERTNRRKAGWTPATLVMES
jgi:hypothetical protein